VLAIAVLASALAAVMGTAIGQVRAEQRLNERFFAGLVAKNVISEIKLTERWPELGERSGEVLQGQRRFRWQMRILPTPSAQMRRVDVQVSPVLSDTQNSADNNASILRLSAFMRQR
jgi:general secretion pathway protein I